MQDHLEEDPAKLFLAQKQPLDFDLKLAFGQLQARQKALKKIPTWAKHPSLVFPPNLSVEQASSEETALFKSGLVRGSTMADLTGGFGVDTFYLSKEFDKAYYCERNEELSSLFAHNMEVLGETKFSIFSGNSIDFLKRFEGKLDLIYADPARRGGHNQKLYKLVDCEPDIVAHWDLLKSKSKSILLKASPMLDLKQALMELPDIQQIWVVSVRNEVKEVLLSWEEEKERSETHIHCIDLHPHGNKAFDFTFEAEEDCVSSFSDIGAKLVEPMAAILKAGAFKSFGRRFGLAKLHPNSHLYTAADVAENVPGRIFEVVQEVSNPKKELKQLFPSGKVNVITRNFAIKAEELKKKYKLKDGGEDYLIGTKVGEKYKLLFCKRIN